MNKLIEIARRIPNSGKTHMFMGNPMSDGCDKTTVEPGNNYSPGVWTCGISVWIEEDGNLYSPDLMTGNDMKWGFDGGNGYPPIIEAKYKAGEHITVNNRLAHLGGEGAEGADFCMVLLSSECNVKISFIIIVRDLGPAGGKIDSMEWNSDRSMLIISNSTRLTLEQQPSEVIILPSDSEFDSPMAVLRYQLEFAGGDTKRFTFKSEHAFTNHCINVAIPQFYPYSAFTVEEGLNKSVEEWNTALPVKVFAPDERIGQTWERAAFHILAAMECGQPRIGAVNYPVFWIRDDIIVLRALDFIGRHDLARKGNDYLAPLYFGGGFGAESDAPGEGIWSLVTHARITKDIAWLEGVFPNIIKRAEYILEMIHTDKTIRIPCESRVPWLMNNATINVLCLPSQNGCIHGRMDGHSPDFFINMWALGGLLLASETAQIIGESEYAEKWKSEAEKLNEAIEKHLLPLYGNDRDPIIAPYPSGALTTARDALLEKFKEWYLINRLTSDGKRKPDSLWTYFEAAQIHNAILLGMKDEAWINLDGMLNIPNAVYIEGVASGNENLPYRTGEGARGWLNPETAYGGNMPHNWTSAEMVNLIRDIFVVEENGMLVLGKGVPDGWLKPGCKFGVKNMPTDLGEVSYTVSVTDQGLIDIDYKGPENYRLDF